MGIKTIFDTNAKHFLRVERYRDTTESMCAQKRIYVLRFVHAICTKDCLQTNNDNNDLNIAAEILISQNSQRADTFPTKTKTGTFPESIWNWASPKKHGFEVKQKSPLMNVKHAVKCPQLNVVNKQAHFKFFFSGNFLL